LIDPFGQLIFIPTSNTLGVFFSNTCRNFPLFIWRHLIMMNLFPKQEEELLAIPLEWEGKLCLFIGVKSFPFSRSKLNNLIFLHLTIHGC
jgi:hypothetical protein